MLILGGARQGQSAARYFARHGAKVTVNDHRPANELKAATAALAGYPINWVFGGHPVELAEQADVICLSGGIPLSLPIVVEAQKRGIPLTNDTQVFFEVVPCQTIGITGSAGKTTTTALVGKIAQTAYDNSSDRVFVGGNIGDPLLNHVDEMKSGDLAILEISSFQLEQMTLSPTIAAILNITPNHLDRHKTMEAYTAAKARILEFQTKRDTAVLNRDDPGSWKLRDKVRGKLVSFGFSAMPAGSQGILIQEQKIIQRSGKQDIPLISTGDIPLRGMHNQSNVLAACAIALAAGIPKESITQAVREFKGVQHRLEFVRKWRGADWYNDSIATAPERSMAAIRSFSEPIVLMLGGRDKDLPWEELANLVRERVDHVILFGEASEKIARALGKVEPGKRPYTIQHCTRLEEAVHAAAQISEPGDVVLLSPGGTSFDEFRDFEDRGEWFCKWVSALS